MSLITAYLQQVCTISTREEDDYGNVTNTGDTTLPCRFVAKTRQVLRPDGTVVLQQGILYLDSNAAPTLDTIYTLDGVAYQPLTIDTKRDLDGNVSHYELAVQ